MPPGDSVIAGQDCIYLSIYLLRPRRKEFWLILSRSTKLPIFGDKLAEKAERTGQIPLITQSNSLRKTAKAKDVELKDLGQKLEDKLQSIKDL